MAYYHEAELDSKAYVQALRLKITETKRNLTDFLFD